MDGLEECRKLLETVKQVAGRLKLRPGSYIAVFGSVAEGRCTKLSDIDLAAKGLDLEEAATLVELVEEATGRRVEVFPIDTEKSSLPLLYEALARGVFCCRRP